MSELARRLEEAGLGGYAEDWELLVRPSIRLVPSSAEGPEIPVGASKLGGEPDLPSTFQWPTFRGRPQSFIAQINLREVHACDRDAVLPCDGLLSFFYDASQRAWTFGPAVGRARAVVYTPTGEALTRHAFPSGLPEKARFRPVGLRPEAEDTLASPESSEARALGLDEEDAYEELAVHPEDTIHRLLGHPDPIQGDMGSFDSRLLLQIDSDEGSGMMWGDTGRLYYWMHKDALAERRWEAAWLELQCC
jgi:uncharacterized protein YwqG